MLEYKAIFFKYSINIYNYKYFEIFIEIYITRFGTNISWYYIDIICILLDINKHLFF